MRLSFKDFLLAEDIFAKNGELFAAVNTATGRKPSTETSISTNMTKLGRQTGTTRGIPVYYAYSYKPNDEEGGSTDLLKSFKGKGPFKFPDARRSTFLQVSSAHMAAEFKKMGLKPDVIVTPQSTSPLTADFAQALAHELGVEATKIGAFKKAPGEDVSSDDKEVTTKIILDKYIDLEYFDEKFTGDPAKRQEALRDLVSGIRRSLRRHGTIVAKEINKPMLKFVKNIMANDLKGDDEYSLMEKTVMVIDDVLSSGATMSDLFRVAKDLGATEVYGCTLFARSS